MPIQAVSLRTSIAAIALIAAWLLPIEAAHAAVVRQPYLQMGSPTSMTIVWRTNVAPSGDSEVEYGEIFGTYDQSATATPVVPDSDFVTGVWDHIVTISGLMPGKKYYYQVGIDGGSIEVVGTTEHFFVTSPVAGSSAPFSMWVVGDSGDSSQAQRDVRDAMLDFTTGAPPDLYLHVGDIAYNNGTDTEWTNNHFAQYNAPAPGVGILRNTVFWPAIGNHDSFVSGFDPGSGTGKGPYFDAHVLPTNAEVGGSASGTESYYSFDYANVHFVVLNSHDTDTTRRGNMLAWLTTDVQATTQDWVIAYWHHPPYTKGSHNSDSEGQLIWMRENALPILEANGVDLVLTGHSHNYERSCLIDSVYFGTNGTPFATLLADGYILDQGDGDPSGDGSYIKAPAPNDGAVYIVTGHGGRTIGGTGTHPVMCNVLGDDEASEYGSTLLSVQGNTLTMQGLLRTGAVNDTFTIVKADWVAYNDLNDGLNMAGGAVGNNPDNGDGNATNVTGHDYFAVDAPLKNFFTGDPLAVTITGLTGTSPTGDKTGCGAEDCYDPTNNDTIANGEVDPGTDADLTFDGHLDYQGVHELDVVDWDNVIEFNNLDPTKTYSIALTANRNNLTYDDARFSRVTIFGADAFTNASSPGVVVNSADSVSFSVGYNTTGEVARWTNVTTGPDGSFSILCEWDDGQGSGGDNTKGYAMALFELMQFSSSGMFEFELMQFSSSGMFEDFESGFDIGQPVGNNSAWFDAGGGPLVTNGIGFGGSVGLAPASNIFTWTAAPFDWNDPSFFGFTAYADFQTDGSGNYDDDRIGFMITDASAHSSNIFGVQLEPLNIEGYWDGVTSDDRRPGIVDLPGALSPEALSPDTFYRFEVAITKLRDATDPLGPAARVDASLWSLDGSGNPLAVVVMGVIPDTSLLGPDEPHEKYFTGPIWPAFKNFSALDGAFDNASVSFISAGVPSLCIHLRRCAVALHHGLGLHGRFILQWGRDLRRGFGALLARHGPLWWGNAVRRDQ